MSESSNSVPPHLSFILGGTRSGKSTYAEKIASSFGDRILYIATAEVWPGEGSLEYRVKKHRERRSESWITLEAPHHIAERVKESGLMNRVDAVILECVTLLTANLLYAQEDPNDFPPFLEALLDEVEALKACIAESPIPWILVSSETGLGIMPPSPESRNYGDGLGIANQILAKASDSVTFMVSGLPLTVK